MIFSYFRRKYSEDNLHEMLKSLFLARESNDLLIVYTVNIPT